MKSFSHLTLLDLDLALAPVGWIFSILNDNIFLLPGLRSSYASQHSQLGQDLRSTVSPDLHITPIYEGRTYYSPVYRSPNHGTVELQGSQTALYRTGSGGHQLHAAGFLIPLTQNRRILLRLD
jgi:hypothetical protein